jgi:hypothetical protein
MYWGWAAMANALKSNRVIASRPTMRRARGASHDAPDDEVRVWDRKHLRMPEAGIDSTRRRSCNCNKAGFSWRRVSPTFRKLGFVGHVWNRDHYRHRNNRRHINHRADAVGVKNS